MPRKWPTDPALKKIPVPIVPPIAVEKNEVAISGISIAQGPPIIIKCRLCIPRWVSLPGAAAKVFQNPDFSPAALFGIGRSFSWDLETYSSLSTLDFGDDARSTLAMAMSAAQGVRNVEEKGGNNAEKFAGEQARSHSISININHREEDAILQSFA